MLSLYYLWIENNQQMYYVYVHRTMSKFAIEKMTNRFSKEICESEGNFSKNFAIGSNLLCEIFHIQITIDWTMTLLLKSTFHLIKESTH